MKFKIVSYNIHRAIGLDRRFKPERIIEILRDIDADIVLLQEVDCGVPRSRELNLAQVLADNCAYKYHQLGLNVQLRKGHYGNATLSRFPIVAQRNINLTIDNKKARGCQFTQIQLKNKKIDFFNLHLGLSAKERQKQAGLLFHSSEYRQNCTAKSTPTPCIIAGDFNDWRSLLRALFIAGMDFKCATDRTTETGEVALKTFPSFAPRGGLDRIYYKNGLKVVNVKRYSKKMAKIASDHLPVIIEFEL